MKQRYTQFLTALRGAQNFLGENDAALGEVNKSGAKAVLDQVTATIASLAVAQGSHRIDFGGARDTELRLARTLRRRHLNPIVKIARANIPEVPRADLKLPPGNGNSTALANFTDSLLGSVAPYTQVFVRAGLPADFAARAQGAAEALVKAITGKGGHRTKRVTATEGIEKHVRDARRAVVMLDSLIIAHIDEGEPILRGWRDARRIIQGGGGPAAAEQPSTAPAAPASTPQASEAPSSKAA